MDLEERIELHIHSKEGGDSTVYVGEIMKQLRLKDIGGIIVIDYIDMTSKKDQNKIIEIN